MGIRLVSAPVDVVVIQRELTHYRIPFFLRIYANKNISIFFSRYDNERTREVAEAYPNLFIKIKGYFPLKSNPYISFLFYFRKVIKARPRYIIHEMSLSIIKYDFVFFLSKIIGAKLIYWGHGYNSLDKEGKSKLRKEIRIFLHKISYASIVYSQGGKTFLEVNGIDPQKIFIAWNTLDLKETGNLKAINKKEN